MLAWRISVQKGNCRWGSEGTAGVVGEEEEFEMSQIEYMDTNWRRMEQFTVSKAVLRSSSLRFLRHLSLQRWEDHWWPCCGRFHCCERNGSWTEVIYRGYWTGVGSKVWRWQIGSSILERKGRLERLAVWRVGFLRIGVTPPCLSSALVFYPVLLLCGTLPFLLMDYTPV